MTMVDIAIALFFAERNVEVFVLAVFGRRYDTVIA